MVNTPTRPSSSPSRAAPPPASPTALGCSRRVRPDLGRPLQSRRPGEALAERPHSGRPPRLAGPELGRFRERLEAGPTPEDGVCTFYGPDLRRILEQEFGVILRLARPSTTCSIATATAA